MKVKEFRDCEKMIQINRKRIGDNEPCFIVAEAGVNHNGDIVIAQRLIDAAVEAGADAIKFQTFNADLLVTPDAQKARYQKKSTSLSESQYQMIKRLELPPHTFKKLSDYANMKKILFLLITV